MLLAPEEAEEQDNRRRRRGNENIIALRSVTKNPLGTNGLAGEITTMEQALKSGLRIREVQVIDALLPELEDEVIQVNMVQRMTDSGRRVRFNVMACVGNRDGFVGLGMAKAKKSQQQSRRQLLPLN